jgi:hypothetical protein
LTRGQSLGLADGRLLVTQTFSGTLSSGAGSASASGTRDGALIVLGSGLTAQSILQLSGAPGTSNRLRAVAVSPDGSMFVGGEAAAGTSIDGRTVSSAGGLVLWRRTTP